MKRIIALALASAVALTASAQKLTLTIAYGESLPEKSAESFQQRLSQMLKANGCEEGESRLVLNASVKVLDSMETPTEPVQTAVSAEVVLSVGEVVYKIPVRGVGDNFDDALSRAILQISPAAKATRSFIDQVRDAAR